MMLNPMLLIVMYFLYIAYCDGEFSNEMPTDMKGNYLLIENR